MAKGDRSNLERLLRSTWERQQRQQLHAQTSDPSSSLPQKKKLSKFMWSWPVVGGVFFFVWSGAVTFMTSGHPILADICYVIGEFLFLLKFLTWEEHKNQIPAKRGAVLAAGFLGTFFLTAFAMWGNHRLNPDAPTADRAGILITGVQPRIAVLGEDDLPFVRDAYVTFTNRGQSRIEPGFIFRVRLDLEPNPLDPSAENELFKRGGGGAVFNNENVIEPQQSIGANIPAEINQVPTKQTVVYVTLQATYEDRKGDLFSEECFYYSPPDFKRSLYCNGHNNTWTKQPANWPPKPRPVFWP